VDPNHDGNAFSFYYYSRLDIHLAGGGHWDCEVLRDGCPGMVSADGYPGNYSYAVIDTSPDASGPGAGLKSGSGVLACPSSSAVRLRLRPVRGAAITKVKVFLDGHLVLTRRRRSLRAVILTGVPGTGAHRVRLWLYTRHGLAKRTSHVVYGCRHRARSKRHRRTPHHRATHKPPPHRHVRDADGDYDGD
jgi:hypothetical protein